MSENVKARSAFGRYPCGEETRQRIIQTAVEIFGRQGFSATSTRDIAEAADIKTPAIQYYFGSKLGLYDACIEQLTASVARRMTPSMEHCRATVAAGSPLDEIVAALCGAQDSLIDASFDGYEGHAIQRLLAWEDAEDTLVASETLMKERIGRPILETFRAVVECVMPPSAPPSEVEIQAMALMSISMMFRINHNRVRGLLNRSCCDNQFLSTLKLVAHRQLTFVLYGLAGKPPPALA